ncbi:hypothetical protein J2741_001684 [Methanolinea mesophila]|uniref:KEOPS complex subunit Pcc1 n=1 Tax=Methanolinea mesophila TaxID=547055 RepID=UPI001AE3C3CE|nr:KEOPS complex subunit Pcc1 [Methanolinea mesophila]MBP1929137.1 hypothetical protein [Methanolinea mesophila]
MTRIEGVIRTVHDRAACVGGAIRPDNLASMVTSSDGDRVVTAVEGHRLRSVIASVDDYLMNLGIAEEICTLASD